MMCMNCLHCLYWLYGRRRKMGNGGDTRLLWLRKRQSTCGAKKQPRKCHCCRQIQIEIWIVYMSLTKAWNCRIQENLTIFIPFEPQFVQAGPTPPARQRVGGGGRGEGTSQRGNQRGQETGGAVGGKSNADACDYVWILQEVVWEVSLGEVRVVVDVMVVLAEDFEVGLGTVWGTKGGRSTWGGSRTGCSTLPPTPEVGSCSFSFVPLIDPQKYSFPTADKFDLIIFLSRAQLWVIVHFLFYIPGFHFWVVPALIVAAATFAL